MATPFLGKGLKFPIKNKFLPEDGVDKVIECIQLLLLTNFGERVMRPTFGSGLGTQIWENLDVVAERGSSDIATSIRRFEPRVTLIEVAPVVRRSEGMILFNIRFLIKEANVEANLVFPFKPSSQISTR